MTPALTVKLLWQIRLLGKWGVRRIEEWILSIHPKPEIIFYLLKRTVTEVMILK